MMMKALAENPNAVIDNEEEPEKSRRKSVKSPSP